MPERFSQPDDAALLWWYALSEKQRTDIEVWCAQEGVSLDFYVAFCSGKGERVMNEFGRTINEARDAVALFADALIDLDWGNDPNAGVYSCEPEAGEELDEEEGGKGA